MYLVTKLYSCRMFTCNKKWCLLKFKIKSKVKCPPKTVRIEKLCSMLQRSNSFLKIVTYFIRGLLSNSPTQFSCSVKVSSYWTWKIQENIKEKKNSKLSDNFCTWKWVFKNWNRFHKNIIKKTHRIRDSRGLTSSFKTKKYPKVSIVLLLVQCFFCHKKTLT